MGAWKGGRGLVGRGVVQSREGLGGKEKESKGRGKKGWLRED